MSADIFERIRATLNGQATSGEISNVIAATKASIADFGVWRAEWEATAIDPTVEPGAATVAADNIVKVDLTVRRLKAALDRLDPVYAAALHAERQARITPPFEKARKDRDVLLAEFRREYPKHCHAIVDLMGRMKAMDRSVLEGLQVPDGLHRLAPLKSEIPRIIDKLALPDLDAASFAWGADHNNTNAMTIEERARADSRVPGEWK